MLKTVTSVADQNSDRLRLLGRSRFHAPLAVTVPFLVDHAPLSLAR